MLRFITGNLTTIDGVSVYPIISLLVFVTVFSMAIIRVMRMKKTEIAEMANLPFSDNTETSDVQTADHKNK